MNKIILKSAVGIIQVSRALANLDYTKPWQVTWKPYKKKRNEDQNALNFVWCAQIRDWLWESGVGAQSGSQDNFRPFTVEEIHNWNKQMFLAPTVVEIGGKQVLHYRSRVLNTVDFRDYLEQIQHYWGEQGLILESINSDEL
jgi:hypothetical protein